MKPTTSIERTYKQPVGCTGCSRKFKRRYDLINHLNRYHFYDMIKAASKADAIAASQRRQTQLFE